MHTSSHSPNTCRCSLHTELEARRHNCYRDLAQAILGPAAPHSDLGLARALAQHASLHSPSGTISQFRPRRDAA